MNRISRISVVLMFVFAPLFAANAQQQWSNFRSSPEWVTFNYPSGFEISPAMRRPNRFVDHHIAHDLGNYGFDFIVLDPVYTVETLQLPKEASFELIFSGVYRDYTGLTMTSSQQIPHRSRRWSYVHGFDKQTGNALLIVGAPKSESYLTIVVAISRNRDIQTISLPVVLDVASSVRFNISPVMSGPELAFQAWHRALASGDVGRLMQLSCAKSRPIMGLSFLGNALIGSTQALNAMFSAAQGVDFSNLSYQIVFGNEITAAVRSSGIIVLSSGRKIQYSENQVAFGSNVTAVRFEQGEWRVCEPVRGGNR